jgi:hypothetical protein
MPDRETEKMEMARLAEILDAYGANPDNWPDAERGAASALLANSRIAVALREDAAALDTALSAVVAPAPSPELMAAILMAAEPSGWRRWAAEFWPFGPVWQPVSALATAAVLGLAIGAAAPSSILPEYADYSAQEEAENMAFGLDLGTESGL